MIQTLGTVRVVPQRKCRRYVGPPRSKFQHHGFLWCEVVAGVHYTIDNADHLWHFFDLCCYYRVALYRLSNGSIYVIKSCETKESSKHAAAYMLFRCSVGNTRPEIRTSYSTFYIHSNYSTVNAGSITTYYITRDLYNIGKILHSNALFM